jgi:murein L,D-transpeptidase YcbB/YkuD
MKRLSVIFAGLTLTAAVSAYFLDAAAKQKLSQPRPTQYQGDAPKTQSSIDLQSLIGLKEQPAEDILKKSDAEMILGYLVHAADHGLQTIDLAPMYETLQLGHNLNDSQKVLLIDALVKFGQEVGGSRIDWSKARKDWAMRPETRDIRTNFDTAIKNDELRAWLDNLAPRHDAYLSLVGARNQYAQIQANGGFAKLHSKEGLIKDANNQQVALLRARLAQEGFEAGPTATPSLYDTALATQVSLYQQAHGLPKTGEVSDKTFAALEVPIENRLKQIDLNLERERWLPRTNPATRIEANIPEATLTYYKENKVALTMATIVGANSTKTPMFTSNVHSIVLNPPWYVPRSISRRQRVQPPGPNNALGRVKFDFLNDFSVYLHDTPNHALFSASRRNLSHGCVRLNKPKDLAELLLAPQGISRAEIDEITSRVVTRNIKLQTQTPVALLYRTAYVAMTGPTTNKVHFVDDVYDWDILLENLLNASRQPSNSATIIAPDDTKIVAAP